MGRHPEEVVEAVQYRTLLGVEGWGGSPEVVAERGTERDDVQPLGDRVQHRAVLLERP